MAVTRLTVRANPVLAFVHNVTAYQLFPYQVEHRRQLSGAFLAMMATGKAEIDSGAAEVVWAIAQSVSPWDTAALVARGAYLLNYGRREELPDIADRLRRVAPWGLETWIINGYVALMQGDRDRLDGYLAKAARFNYENDNGVRLLAEELRRLQ